MYDFNLLPKLIKASGAMDQAQKDWMLSKLSKMDDTKKAEIYDILKTEQQTKKEIYKGLLAKKKEYEHKRAKTIYSYIERKVSEEEDKAFADIEAQLEIA